MALARPSLLLEKLRDSGLLEQSQIKEVSLLPEAREADPRALGREVLKRGWLTRYELNVIAQGRGKDLNVGPYLLLDRLGEGGMGQVFKARHQKMRRVVALKIIRKEKLAGQNTVNRFYERSTPAGAPSSVGDGIAHALKKHLCSSQHCSFFLSEMR